MATSTTFERDRRDGLRGFAGRALIVAAIAALLFLAWHLRHAFLLVIAALVVAVLVDAAARPIRRWTKLTRIWGLAVAGVAIGVVAALLALLVGSQVQAQVPVLVD